MGMLEGNYCALQVGCQAASCKVYVNYTPHNRKKHTLWWKYSTLDHRVLFCAVWLAVHSDNQPAKHNSAGGEGEPEKA